MELISSDFKKGLVKIYITDIEDLWYLSNLIDPGDFLKAKTTRKIKIGDSENAKIDKKTVTLKIEAEQIDYDQENNALRVNGRIQEAPEFIPLGNYHALALEVGTEFTLEKPNWLTYQKQKLQEAAQKKYSYLLCLMDREEALFALTQKSGYKILLELKGDVPKKGRDHEVKKDFYEEIITVLDVYSGRHNPEHIILASPAFYKEDLYKKIKDPELRKKITLSTCSDVSPSSLDEVMKRPELKTVLQNSRARKEELLIDELLQEINKENLASYGWREVKKTIEAGAVSKLLLSENFIKKKRANNEYEELDELMKTVDSLKAEIYILSSENVAGKKLDGLGGIAAILRYKMR